MTYSTFVSHYLAHRHQIPAAVAADIRRVALARLHERQQAGRADGVLTFDDLINRIEQALGG